MNRKTLIGISLLVCLGASPGCSVFDLGEYDSFKDWYIGPPGMERMLSANKDGQLTGGTQGIYGSRPPIYGHFRLPEVLFQPKGGLRYPMRRTRTTDTIFKALEAQQGVSAGQTYSYEATTITTDSAKDSLGFDLLDAGLVEILPYRTWFSAESGGYKVGMTMAAPFTWLVNFSGAFIRLPVYAVHDIAKLAMTPVAAVYYGSGDDSDTGTDSQSEEAASR